MPDEELIPEHVLREATTGQLEEYEKLLKQRRALLSPLDYALYVTPSAQEYPHSRLISDTLKALVEWRLYKDGPGPESVVVDVSPQNPNGTHVHPVTGEHPLRKVMIWAPPQIGKSYIVGRHFPGYVLSNYPDDELIYMSYAAGLAETYSGNNKENILSHPELGISLRDDTQSKKDWRVAGHEGGLIARGWYGVPTGRGADGLIVDDPFQDGEQAMVDVQRERVYEQYISSIRKRMRDGAWEAHINTRWHEDDLSGRLLAKEPAKWYVLHLPAVSFDTVDADGVSFYQSDNEDDSTKVRDALGRGPHEAICPAIATVRFYEEAQEDDPFWYDAQFLGLPSGVAGTIFKEFNYYKKHQLNGGKTAYELFTGGDQSAFVQEDDCVRFGILDLAISEKRSADYTVLGVFDLDPWKRILLREIIRERVSGPEHEDFIRTHATEWGCRAVGIEDATYGTRLIQDLIIAGGITIWPLKADADKKVRAIPATTLFKKKLYFIDRDAAWRAKYESELKKFDRDAHDDQVDVTAYATRMRDYLTANPIPPKAKEQGLTGIERTLAELADAASEKEQHSRLIISQ